MVDQVCVVYLGDRKCSCTLLDVRGHDALVACSWPNQPPVLVRTLSLFDVEVQFSSIQLQIRPKFSSGQFIQFKIQFNSIQFKIQVKRLYVHCNHNN